MKTTENTQKKDGMTKKSTPTIKKTGLNIKKVKASNGRYYY